MRKSGLTLAAMLLAVVVSWPSTGAAQLALYDDFAGPLIDPSKWWGIDTFSGPGSPTTEFVRAITRGGLRLAVTQYGLATSNSGSMTGAIRLRAQDLASMSALQVKVTMTAGNAEVCPTNSNATSKGRAQLLGAFFNDGTSSGASDETGDVFAGIQVTADGTLGNVIEGFFATCMNASCSSNTAATIQAFNTKWAVNKAVTITITRDAAHKQFVYSVKVGRAPAETVTLPYAMSDAAAAVVPFKQIAANSTAPNCNGSQFQALADAKFDNFMIAP